MKVKKKIYILVLGISVLGLIMISRLVPKSRVAGVNTETNAGPIRGVIIPHHELAGSLIGESLSKVKEEGSHDKIVVLGTNHFQPDSYLLTTSTVVNDFPIDSEFVEQFVKNFPGTVVDESIMENDHAATLPMTYLTNFFPEAKYVSFLVSPFYTEEELNSVADYIVNNLPENTLYVAAVDFAHQVSLNEGLAKNEESNNAISNFDYQTLYSYQDDHMDSPIAIALLLKIMEKLDAKNWETWESSHAALMSGDEAIQGTSYVLGVFR